MENTNYEEMLRDVEPSDQIVPYLMTQEMAHLTIYRKEDITDHRTGVKYTAVRCTCSACGEEYLADYVPHETYAACRNAYLLRQGRYGFLDAEGHPVCGGDKVFCPRCQEETDAYYIGMFGSAREISTDEYAVQEIRNIDGHLTLLQWYYKHVIDRDGHERLDWMRYNAFVVESGKVVRLNAFRRVYYYGYFGDCFRQSKRCVDDYGEITHLMPFDVHILDGTPAENSKLDIYLAQKGHRLYPVSYLRLYLKHKNVENLMTCGAGGLVAEMIEKEWASGSGYQSRCIAAIPKLGIINWRAVKPAEMLGIDKAALRRAVAEKWDKGMLMMYRYAKSAGEELTREELRAAVDRGVAGATLWIREHGMSIGKTVRYLMQQEGMMSDYRDYYDMAQENGHNMTDSQVLHPKNLRLAHAAALALYKSRARREQHEQFIHRAKVLGKYAWESGGILIRPVADENELVYEGDALHHCVATYADRHCRAECAIFLIRRIDAPDEPWYTLDLNERTLTVNQNRGMKNCARTKEIAAFEAAWIEHIRNIKAKKKKEKQKTA